MKQLDRDIKNHVRNVIKINQTQWLCISCCVFFYIKTMIILIISKKTVSVMKQNFPLQTENSMLLCVCCDLNVNMQAPKGVFFESEVRCD